MNRRYASFFMWSLPLAFFTYQFILRLWPSLMMKQIMQQFAIDATAFGVLASFYYYGYAGMQIPIAILLERFGVRLIVFLACITCGLASFAIIETDNWYVALIARFLIGAASGVGFLGVSKVISEWFPKSDYARMVGFSFTVGLMGAIYGGKPVSLLIETYPWQKVAFVLAVVSVTIGLLSFAFLRSPSKIDQEKTIIKFSDFKKIPFSLVIIAFANLLMVGSLEGFADVWGVNYLVTAYGITKSKAAELTSFIFVGMLFGGPLLAYLSRKFGNYNMVSFCGVGMAILLSYLIFSNYYNYYLLLAIFFMIGIMCCYQVLVFAVGSEIVAPHLLGVTIAFLNCINMLGGAFFHSLIGFTMDSFWNGALQDGIRTYNLESYKYGLLIIPVCACLGALMVKLVSHKKI